MSRSSPRVLLAVAAGLACLALTPAAQAGGYGPGDYGPGAYGPDGYGSDRYSAVGDGGWTSAEEICRQMSADVTRCRWSHAEGRIEDGGVQPARFEEVHVPDSFFADEGGVGPAFIDSGESGGGGVVFAEAGASAGASASASASARVSVSVGFRGGFRPPMMMKHGCGCSGGGHRW